MFLLESFHLKGKAGFQRKDGSSAGVTMATAMVSALSGVLSLGGVKKKALGTVREEITEVLLPKDQRGRPQGPPKKVRDTLEIHFAEDLGDMLTLTLRGASHLPPSQAGLSAASGGAVGVPPPEISCRLATRLLPVTDVE